MYVKVERTPRPMDASIMLTGPLWYQQQIRIHPGQMCGDYCRLNRITKSDRYPMPMAEEIFDKLAEGKVYSTLDLRQGLNQIPIKEEDKPKTAFHGPDRLPLGCCSPCVRGCAQKRRLEPSP
ncbi:hypothetical protein CLOP_g7981 [Closterium sp. NIES-67]|nr:hypothetical protein CLOP_g7981 [Closterium sp. NIES-67]